MKKKLLSIMVVAIVAIATSYNAYISQDNENLSDLTLSNVEALADPNESSGGCKLHLTSICETAHYDHYLYRNN